MGRISLLLAAAMLVSSVAGAQTYDIEAYCQTVAQAVGGSYVIEKGCRDQEASARQSVAGEAIEDRVRRYCDEVARAVGGSYVIFQGCVDQEQQAKRDLGR